MTGPFKIREKRDRVKAAEAAGLVADSTQVRMALMERFHRGELTLDDVQAELKRIKRNAKRNGLVTQNAVYCGRT